MTVTLISDERERVIDQALEMMKRSPAGREALKAALRSAGFAFEANAFEYAKTGAFDYAEQAHLSRLAHEMADQLDEARGDDLDADSIDDIPF